MHTSSHPANDGRRNAGVLLHPTSLPGIYGVGELGDEAVAFLDWAQSAGVHIWQVLPLNPTGYGASPYGCLSSFAGNPLLISPQRLLQEGLLDPDDVADVPRFSDEHVEFDRVHAYKMGLLRTSWTRFNDRASEELQAALQAFVESDEQQEWLDDYALYMALKESAGGAPWWKWESDVVARDEKALSRARGQYEDDVRFWKYVQFQFFRQWNIVREAAHARGIRIMGDVPIYVACDSADVWGNRELFQLNEQGEPTFVAGVPPDYFSATGQRWGNPLYRWDRLAERNYDWWVKRFRGALQHCDVVRLDHFRGFEAYWEVPAEHETAVQGRWAPGPGAELFTVVEQALGRIPMILEDLGLITPEVERLRDQIGYPGMKVLQFAFGDDANGPPHGRNPYLPHNYSQNCVVYTGTHDNDTTSGWFNSLGQAEQHAARRYLGVDGQDIAWDLIRAALASVARTTIVPVQDLLNLGSEARMNQPGRPDANWGWRYRDDQLDEEAGARLAELTAVYGREPRTTNQRPA